MNEHAPAAGNAYESNGSNGLGLAGFIVSLVGFIACGGLICPIGLIMSLVALTKRPKGFAIAGVVIGALGSLGFVLVFFVFGIAALMALVGLGLAVAAASIGQNGINIYKDIETYHDANGKAPAVLTDLGTFTPAELEDTWGTPIRYTVSADGQEIWLRSDGKDKAQGTGDDIEFYRNFKTDDFHLKSDKVNIGS